MSFLKHSILLLFCIGLLSCTDEPVKARKDAGSDISSESENHEHLEKSYSFKSSSVEALEKTASSEIDKGSEKLEEVKEDAKRPSVEEVQKADRIISFSNQAHDILNKGIYVTVDTLRNNALHYRKNWTMPKHVRLPGTYAGDARLKTHPALFNEEEEKLLAQSLDRMDKALNEVLTYYRQLEKYINDNSIIDDGKKGLELSESLLKSHTLYSNARQSWLKLVEARAEEAEARLLYEHPLKRQILEAKNIFAHMGKIEELGALQDYKKEEMEALRQNLSATIEQAGRPPFKAPPELERLFRAFLKDAQSYCKILDRSMQEGFHNIQKREIKAARIKCQDSYNKFVYAANKLV